LQTMIKCLTKASAQSSLSLIHESNKRLISSNAKHHIHHADILDSNHDTIYVASSNLGKRQKQSAEDYPTYRSTEEAGL
jgi:hypothetical protein